MVAQTDSVKAQEPKAPVVCIEFAVYVREEGSGWEMSIRTTRHFRQALVKCRMCAEQPVNLENMLSVALGYVCDRATCLHKALRATVPQLYPAFGPASSAAASASSTRSSHQKLVL